MFAASNPRIGYPQPSPVYTLDTTERFPQGEILAAVDPFWGGAEFRYVKFGGTVPERGLCSILCTYNSTLKRWEYVATAVANTANLGRDLAVAMRGATSGQFGWVMIAGLTPINGTASVAADSALGITAAGQVGANSAGKQVLNARVAAAATTTVALANSIGVSGSYEIRVQTTDGLFIGAYLSGTGVGASAKIAAIDPSNNTITADVVNSAAINGTVTATYNNATIYYNVVQINRPFAQGAIT